MESRRFIACRASAQLQSDDSKRAKSIAELDRFIDNLMDAEGDELTQMVAENVLLFDQGFWLRVATRAETSEPDDVRDYGALANRLMGLVEQMVRKTEQRIESATDVLTIVMRAAADESGELTWPLPPARLEAVRAVVATGGAAGELDEAFLSGASAQLRKAMGDGDKPGLVGLLQQILKLWAVWWLGRRSYTSADANVAAAEALLERVMAAEEAQWDALLQEGLLSGPAPVSKEAFQEVTKMRTERVFMRTESGSYTQRILAEYVGEVEQRGLALLEASRQGPPQIQGMA